MRYRDHKGGLTESLNTTKNIYSEDELISHLNKQCTPWGEGITDVKFERVGIEKRMDWGVYYVLIKLQGQVHFSVVGMSDSNEFIMDVGEIVDKLLQK